jgi:hypothetical protein
MRARDECSKVRKCAFGVGMSKIGKTACCLMAVVSLTPVVNAATLDVSKSSVTVTRGGAPSAAAAGSSTVNPGDVVRVGQGGAARVVYSGQCSVAVQAGATYVVKAVAPCPGTVTNSAAGAAAGPGALELGLVVGAAGIGAAVIAGSKSSSP